PRPRHRPEPLTGRRSVRAAHPDPPRRAAPTRTPQPTRAGAPVLARRATAPAAPAPGPARARRSVNAWRGSASGRRDGLREARARPRLLPDTRPRWRVLAGRREPSTRTAPRPERRADQDPQPAQRRALPHGPPPATRGSRPPGAAPPTAHASADTRPTRVSAGATPAAWAPPSPARPSADAPRSDPAPSGRRSESLCCRQGSVRAWWRTAREPGRAPRGRCPLGRRAPADRLPTRPPGPARPAGRSAAGRAEPPEKTAR